MQVCRIALKLIRRGWMLFAVYVFALSAMGVVMGQSVSGQASGAAAEGSVWEGLPSAAVIDRDDSEVSRALAAYVRAHSSYVELEDSTFALQDAAARDLASYVLVIPEGWGEGLLAAARSGEEVPELGRIVSYSSAEGSLMDERVRGWAQELYALAAASAAPAEELLAWVDETAAAGVEVTAAQAPEQGLPTDYLVYCQFATYPLFGGIAAIVAQGLESLRDHDVRRRIGASCVGAESFGRQVALAIALCGVLVWVASGLFGFAVYGYELVGVPVMLIALVMLALFALSLVGTAFGYLLWTLGVTDHVAHAVANIASMVLTFLAGTWVSIDQMGPTIEAVARFTPGYWTVRAITAVYEAPVVSAALVEEVLVCAATTALFALAVAVVALALGRVRGSRTGIPAVA